MENVNKQLIVAAKDVLALHDNEVFVADPWSDSMEDLRQAIAAAEQAQQAEPVACDVIAKLVALTRAVNIALDDSEERDGMDGREHVIGSVNFDAVCDALEVLEELPDNKPGWAMNAADKAAWALRHLTDATQPPAVAVLQAELDEWRKLRDPKVLHVNLCRGFPAKLTAEQLLHIAGDEKQSAVAVPSAVIGGIHLDMMCAGLHSDKAMADELWRVLQRHLAAVPESRGDCREAGSIVSVLR